MPEALSAARLAVVERTLDDARRSLGIPGLSAAMALGPEHLWSKGFGVANVEKDVPAAENTVYRLASVSKTITAVAALQLAAEGKLDLDSAVQRYVPDFPKKQWPITSRHLLTHQSGFRHWTLEEWASTEHYSSISAALEPIQNDPLIFEPGTQDSYSSIGYTVLGRVIEGASGRSYMAYVRDKIFAPARMTHARDDDARAVVPQRAAGYKRDGTGRLRTSIASDTSGKLPAGGLLATAPDMARFGASLMAGELLDKATFNRMCTAQTLKNGTPVSVGLGFRVTEHRAQLECWQQGAQPEVSGLLYLRPRRGVAVALFCNLENMPGALLDIARRLADVATARNPAPR
jgi:serine beta-lactamase-like protein LACTB, mitochondrial